MIVEINFIEPKRKINRAPYYAGFVTVLLLAAIVYFLFWVNQYYLERTEALSREMETNQASVQEIQREAALINQRQMLQTQIVEIEESIFPTVELMDRFIQLLPDGGFFQGYNFVENTVTIPTRMDTYSDTASYMNVLQQQPFITSVQVNSVQSTAVSEDQYHYQATYVITIDEQAWMEEAKAQ